MNGFGEKPKSSLTGCHVAMEKGRREGGVLISKVFQFPNVFEIFGDFWPGSSFVIG